MMNCDDWRSFAHDYAFGDLSPAARELLNRHASSCTACLGEALALQRVDRGLRDVATLEPPPNLHWRALESAPSRPSRELWRVAAALLLAGTVGIIAISTTVVDRMPDELRRAPLVLSRAAEWIPALLTPRE